MSKEGNDRRLSRRDLLVAAGTGVLAAAGIGLMPGLAAATEADVDKLMAEKIGSVKPKDGKITLTLPEIAENGATVPFTVKVDSPMTDKDYVKSVHVFTEGNPTPGVASYHFTPANGKAEISSRMRLGSTQKVRVVAVMSNGDAHMVRQEIKVTVGGCGG
ncbi:MAG: thiosulfate oxidation carrier protein SoxY [Alphaproteobacteria bacterium]